MTTVMVDFQGWSWINLASDPTQAVRIQRRSGVATKSVKGEVRPFAGGRMRGIVTDQVSRNTKLSFRVEPQDRAILTTLDGWTGQIVCLRDELGRRDFGMYFDFPETDLDGAPGWVDVDLAIQAVTYNEGV